MDPVSALVPASQLTQVSALAPRDAVENRPAKQLVHADEPVLAAYEPGRHEVHAEESAAPVDAPNWPTPQAKHALAPEAGW